MAKRTATPPPPPWMSADGSGPPQRPYLPTPLPGVVEGDDPWAGAAADLAAARRMRRPRMPLWPAVVLLFVVGLTASIVATVYWTGEPDRVAVVVQPTWHPGDGALVRGMPIDGGTPQSLAWSPDGGQLAWSTFDGARTPITRIVPIDEDFGEVEQLRRSPRWLSSTFEGAFRSSVEEDLVVVRRDDGSTAGVIDLRGLLGLVDAKVPVVHTSGDQIRLAVVARLPSAGALPSLHVFDISTLVRPPQPEPITVVDAGP